jgi:hypothetical protein
VSQDVHATVAAVVSGGSAATAVIAEAMPWLQVIAVLVAIVSGAMAIRYHYVQTKRLQQ